VGEQQHEAAAARGVSRWVAVGEGADELAIGRMLQTRAGELDLAVARLDDGTLTAFDLWCTHEECPLSDGDLEGFRVVCYCHSSEFDVRTGEVLRGPATEPIAVYATRSLDGRLEIEFEGT
jgi:3-phenylpropionate/trans-cinnamate dioxygenase ferredoxin subunit